MVLTTTSSPAATGPISCVSTIGAGAVVELDPLEPGALAETIVGDRARDEAGHGAWQAH